MLDIHQTFRTNKTWAAIVTLPDGRQVRATAYIGASNKLARMLQNMGVPDQPIRIFNPTGNEALERPSLYEWGVWDYQAELRKWLLNSGSVIEIGKPVE